MRIENEAERSFYEIESAKTGWGVRTLQRQYNSSLYERLALSRDKEGVLRLATEGNVIAKPEDIIKQPTVLEFLGMKKKQSILKQTWKQPLLINYRNFYWNWERVIFLKRGRNGLHMMKKIFMWI